jgi:hypothetical protein
MGFASDLAEKFFLLILFTFFYAAWMIPFYMDRHGPVHESGTVAASGIILDPTTGRAVRIMSKSAELPQSRRFTAFFYIHVEPHPSITSNPKMADGKELEWKPRYNLWCYEGDADVNTESPHFMLALSTLDIAKQGTYKIDVHVRVRVPEAFRQTSSRSQASALIKKGGGNKCILAEEDSVPLSEIRWELHIVPEWHWSNILPVALVDEFYRACAIMGISFGMEQPPGRGSTWHDGTDITDDIVIYRKKTVTAFLRAVDAAAFLNRTFHRMQKEAPYKPAQ